MCTWNKPLIRIYIGEIIRAQIRRGLGQIRRREGQLWLDYVVIRSAILHLIYQFLLSGPYSFQGFGFRKFGQRSCTEGATVAIKHVHVMTTRK